jgi:D-psicose/D-tagatose/L-ribulose 3-epimerase
MKFGIHFALWGDDYNQLGPEVCLKQAREIGAESYEYFPTPAMLEMNPGKIKEMRNLVEGLGIEPVFTFGYPLGWDMTSDDKSMRDKAIEHIKKAIGGMGLLGSRIIGGIVYSNWPARYDAGMIGPDEKKRRIEHCIESLKQVMSVAADNDVTVCLEIVNRFEHYLMNTAEEGITICKAVDSSNCKLLLDCFHMNIEEEDILQAIRSARGYLGHFHVSEPNRTVPHHDKRLNWSEIGKALNDIGYDKSVIVESFYRFGEKEGHNWRRWRNLAMDTSLQNLLKIGKEGIRYTREQFTKEAVV